MNKKSLFKLMKVAIVAAVVLLMMLPVSVFADDPAEPDEPDPNTVVSEQYGMTLSKHANVLENGEYIIDIDAFANGKATYGAKPVDLILVLDVSGSMDETMDTYEFTARDSQGYTYSNYGSNEYYYLHTDNQYYQVRRYDYQYGRDHYYALYYRVGNTTYYLSGTGTQTSYTWDYTSSNSTIWTGVLYTRTKTSSTTKIAALKTAVNNFIDVVADKNKEIQDKLGNETQDKDLSRVGIVKLAYGKYPDENAAYSNYQEGNHHYNYGDHDGYNYTEVYKDLKVVYKTDMDTEDGWHKAVNDLYASGATAADYAMGFAQAMYNRHKTDEGFQDRDTVIVMFTDGEPNHDSGFTNSVARATINTAKELKAANVKVFTVAVLQGADPSIDPTSTNNYSSESVAKINQYLHAVSSNYKTATPASSGFTITWGDRTMKEDGVTKEDFYFKAESAEELDKIFTAIAESSASSEIGAEAVLTDIISSSFTLPKDANVNDINVQIVRWNSYQHRWGTEEDTDGGEKFVFTPAEWKDVSTTYGAKSAEEVSLTLQDDGKTIDVTGFDYSVHYKATDKKQDNDQDDKPNGFNKNTAKTYIWFKVDAKPSAVTGGSVATNDEESGLYVNNEQIIALPVPKVVFTPVTYVVDYVTSDTSHDTKASTIKLEYDKILNNVEMLDKPGDDYLVGLPKSSFDYTIYNGNYGTISFGDDQFDVERRYVRYAPTTMNWNGYDRIFVKGEAYRPEGEPAPATKLNVWAMLCVIPANSVFYEDTYISQTKSVEYNGKTVEIVYTGINYGKVNNEDAWMTVGTEGKNQTQHAGDEMGWIEGLADDSEYANDMAHASSTAKAKATFTFSGTGVDIYSRTNGTTGTVSVRLQGVNPETGKKFSKSKVIDTKAAAGDFFMTPVCTFTDLTYGEYTVTIMVTGAAQNEERFTFYLDGIRVYNPIQPLEGEENVQKMYGEKNLGAVFTEVRSMLLADPAAAEAEALYIDEHIVDKDNMPVADIATAAAALAEAQAARDEYVESTITPAKNAVSEEEYALSSAESAVESAQKVLTAAQAALAADPENAELQAAVADAETKLANAQTALQTAQNHYNDNIDALNATLEAAIAGRAEKDAAVEAARAAYENASDGTIQLAQDLTIEEYKKEGPKAEVLLDKGQMVAINVESGKTYYIGLRSLKGDEVTARIGTKTLKLSHTADLYYEVTPSDGKIVIENASADKGPILSVTKLRTTSAGNTTKGTKLASTEETLNYVRRLNALAATDYTGEILTAEEAQSVVDEFAAAAEETEAVLEESDVTIDNPEPEAVVEEEAPTAPAAASAWSRLLSSFAGFFRR